MFEQTTYMAPRRVQPPLASPNYPILDELLSHVQQGGYSMYVAEDVVKIINCLKFIEVNLELIGFFVEHRQHICQERGYDSFRTYVYSDGSPLVLSDCDKKNGVLRDAFGTSIHFNSYHDAQHVKLALLSYLNEFNDAACAMQKLNQLKVFLERFEYDKHKDCIEARTSRALKISKKIRFNDGHLSLDDLYMNYLQLTQDCYAIALGRSKTMVQYHFLTHKQANSFVAWVKSSNYLQRMSTRKANVSTEAVFQKTTFVVRLSIQQYCSITQASEPTLPQVEAVVADKRNENQVNTEQSSQSVEVLSSKTLGKIRDQLANQMMIHLDTEVFRQHIKGIGSNHLNQAVTIEYNGWTLLHSAAEYLSEASFLAFLDELTDDTVSALITKSMQFFQSTPLHLAARFQRESGFIALMNKVSLEALRNALAARTNNDETPVHIAAQFQTAAALLECIKKLNPMTSYSVELLSARSEECTVLHTVAKYQGEDVFRAYVEVMTAESLGRAMVCTNNKDLQSGLFLAARFQPHIGFSELVAKVSADAVSAALRLQDIYGHTALHHVFQYQPVENVKALIIKADEASISYALPFKNIMTSSVLTVCMKEKPSLILLLLSKSSFGSLEKAAIASQPNYVVKNILRLLCCTHEEEWGCYPGLKQKLMNFLMIDKVQIKKPVELMLPYLIHRGASSSIQLSIMPFLCQLSMSHHTHFAFLSFLSLANQEKFTASDRDAVRSEALKQRIHLFEVSTNRFITAPHTQSSLKPQTIMLSTQEGIPVTGIDTKNTDPVTALCQMIWHAGLASWLEYYALIHHHGEHSKVGMTLLAMHNMQTVLSGVADTVPLPVAAINHLLGLHALIQSGNCLMKVVTTSNVDLLLDALADYTYRPEIRESKDSDSLYKYRHMTDTIELIPTLKIKYPKQRTRKTAVTWISPQLQTPLFSLHHELNGMVAFAFNRKACVIKAMLASDVGTYHRGWVGEESKVANYAQSIFPYNFTDEAAFIKHIETSGLVNEVLAELTKEALEAIVVCIDSDRSREIALQYQAKVKAKLGIELPIVFYDHAAQVLVPYYIEAKKFTSAKPSLLSQLSKSMSKLFARKERSMSEAEEKLAAQLCFSP